VVIWQLTRVSTPGAQQKKKKPTEGKKNPLAEVCVFRLLDFFFSFI